MAAIDYVPAARGRLLDDQKIEKLGGNLLMPGVKQLAAIVKINHLQIPADSTRNDAKPVLRIAEPRIHLRQRGPAQLVRLP